MSVCIRRVITTAFVCHLILTLLLLTSQLLLAQSSSNETKKPTSVSQPPQAEPSPNASLFEPQGNQGEEVIISSHGPQEKNKDVYHLRDDVQIEYSDYTLHADDVVYDSASGNITATGHVSLDGGLRDEHIEASRAELNIRTFVGRFEDVVATTGVRFKGRNIALTNAE